MINIYAYSFVHLCVWPFFYLNVWYIIYMCVCIYLNVWYIHICVYIHIYVYTYMYIHIYVYITWRNNSWSKNIYREQTGLAIKHACFTWKQCLFTVKTGLWLVRLTSKSQPKMCSIANKPWVTTVWLWLINNG